MFLKTNFDLAEHEQMKARVIAYESTPDADKGLCRMYISTIERRIHDYHIAEALRQQYQKYQHLGNTNILNSDVVLELTEPFGNSFGIYVKVENYVMELCYKPEDEERKNEIRTKFYLDVNGLYKSFVLRKNMLNEKFQNIQKMRRNYYVEPVTYGNWADKMTEIINAVKQNTELFLQMCELSCPFKKDGRSKYKSWKTFAAVEITYDADTGLVQGIKNGERLPGSHVVGSNGSFRYFNKGKYVIKYTVDKMACEKPIKCEQFVDADEYLRGLKEKMGYTNMPYQKLNAKLTEKVAVITYDTDKDPEERCFFPIDYDMNWKNYLIQKLEDQ